MNRIALFALFALALALFICSCSGEGFERKISAEEVAAYKPNLPAVPTIPKPSTPETFSDGSYSVYGLRRAIRSTINQQVSVTAYIAKIYQKPECPEGQTCHTLMPHLFLADEASETLERRHLRLVGYAQSFKEMEEEKEAEEKGDAKELPEGVFLPPVVWDWRQGHKYKIKGTFTRQSGAGFMQTDGLLDYESHECLDCPAEEEDEKNKKKKK